MKKKVLLGKFLAGFFVLAMCLGLFSAATAQAATYFTPANATGTFDVALEPGKSVHVVIPVKAKDFVGSLYSVSAVSNSDYITISNIKLTNPALINQVETPIISISTGTTYNFEFDIYTSDTAKIGYNTINITGTGEIYDIGMGDFGTQTEIPLYNVSTYIANELVPADIVVESNKYDESLVLPEQNFTMKLKLKNAGEIQALNAYLTMDFGNSGIIPDYKVEKIKVGTLGAGADKTVDVPVKVLKTATPGFYQISATITAKDAMGRDIGPFVQSMYITVKEKEPEKVDNSAPSLSISTGDNYMELVPDTNDEITVKVKNKGDKDAINAKLAVKDGLSAGIGLTKAYTSNYIEIGTVKVGEEVSVKIPVNVAKNFAAGLYELDIEVEYTDANKKEIAPATMTMYVKGPVSETVDTTVNNTVSISGVTQNPANPKAGETVTVSFTVTNEGNAPVSNVRVYGVGLSSNGFEPVSSEPYQKVGTIPANSTAKVSMSFKVGANIPEGFNGLNIGYSYTDANKQAYNAECMVYILNVVNEKKEAETVISKPKLIISNSYTDVETLRAGEEFDFTFELKNTHSTKSAKNIKVTLSQAEGCIAPAKGSNILYIDEIKASNVVTNTIRLKSRGDVITGDYGIAIKVEYEYDDMSEADQEKGGVFDENEIKLHVLENYRPVIENVTVDAWNGITVGNPVDLSFEFYNMGKSTLGNVYVTVEGDFVLANNSAMSYVGAVNGYSQEYVNPQIVALVGGEAVGTLVVHFEDSNGDEVTISQEFTAYVTEENYEGGYEDWGGEFNPGYEGEWSEGEYGYGEEENPSEGFSFLGLTLIPFICVCAGIVLVVVVIIVIVVKKKKAARDEDDDE